MSTDRDVVILSMARTPFGRFGGALKEHSAIRLGAIAMAEAVHRSGVDPADVQSVYAGIGMIGANVLTATRQALLLGSGLPETVPSMGIDRSCCSGMTSIGMGYREIREAEIGNRVEAHDDEGSLPKEVQEPGHGAKPLLGDLAGEETTR